MKYQVVDLSIPKGAVFSDDRKYRYVLWRIWNNNRPILLQIGLNPSKADETRSDPTITRGIVRADKMGFGGFLMANLYAYVSTQPKVLLGDGNFIGEDNDYFLKEMIKISDCQLCGWGSFPPVAKRAPSVLAMINKPYCLGINQDGQPKHPLYIGYNVPMIKYCLGNEVESDIALT